MRNEKIRENDQIRMNHTMMNASGLKDILINGSLGIPQRTSSKFRINDIKQSEVPSVIFDGDRLKKDLSNRDRFKPANSKPNDMSSSQRI